MAVSWNNFKSFTSTHSTSVSGHVLCWSRPQKSRAQKGLGLWLTGFALGSWCGCSGADSCARLAIVACATGLGKAAGAQAAPCTLELELGRQTDGILPRPKHHGPMGLRHPDSCARRFAPLSQQYRRYPVHCLSFTAFSIPVVIVFVPSMS
jgi:hypothetical protein